MKLALLIIGTGWAGAGPIDRSAINFLVATVSYWL